MVVGIRVKATTVWQTLLWKGYVRIDNEQVYQLWLSNGAQSVKYLTNFSTFRKITSVLKVGLVAKMQKENKELVIGGTLQQKISSCLEVLDILVKHNYPVVSSMVVAEKYNHSGILTAVEAVAQVLGINDMKTISQYTTFAELGMDSLMGVEIIQILEKDFEIYVTSKDVRSLTFAK